MVAKLGLARPGMCTRHVLERLSLPFADGLPGRDERVRLQHRYPRRAASIFAMSIFPISIIAAKARLASAPPAAIARVRARGVICQDNPQRSLHQPQALSWPPLPTIAFQ